MNAPTRVAEARARSVEFPYLLSNHAPMCAAALRRLGASPARVDAWTAGYAEAHGLVAPPPPVAPISLGDWRAHLGDRARESDYRALFVAEARRLGIAELIVTYVPALARGVSGSALHPLMRLAYATLDGDVEEAGVAIGYWATCYLALPAAGHNPPDTDDPGAVLAGVAQIEGVRDYVAESDLLWHNIRAVAELPGFAGVVDRLAFGPDTPRRLAATALALMAATMDFCALHAVTGLHWVRLVAAHLDDAEPLYRYFWQAIAALVPKIGFPAAPDDALLAEQRARAAPSWSAIHAAAAACEDEHDISFVYSAFAEEQAWGDPLYRVTAARRVGLIA